MLQKSQTLTDHEISGNNERIKMDFGTQQLLILGPR